MNNVQENIMEATTIALTLQTLYFNARVSQGFGNAIILSDLTKHFNDNGGVSDVPDYYNNNKDAYALLAELAYEFNVTYKSGADGLYSMDIGWPLNHKHATELRSLKQLPTKVDQHGCAWVSVTDVEPSITITKAAVAMLDQMREYGYTPMFYGYYHTWEQNRQEPEFIFE